MKVESKKTEPKKPSQQVHFKVTFEFDIDLDKISVWDDAPPFSGRTDEELINYLSERGAALGVTYTHGQIMALLYETNSFYDNVPELEVSLKK